MIDKAFVVPVTLGMETVPVPGDWKMPEIRGIALGGCVDGGKRFRRMAHAHNRRSGEHFGWVCFLGKRRWLSAGGGPSRIMWHEYAHILTPSHGHDDKWRAKMRELGQPIPTRYK